VTTTYEAHHHQTHGRRWWDPGGYPVQGTPFGEIEIDFSRQQVRRAGGDVPLSTLEFEVLRYFVAHKGQIIERDQLLHEVWGYHAFRTTRAVDNLVGRLRQKLERQPHEPKQIVTVYGVGYRFVE
jgi:DNA-binding response OmpR family regulator